MRPSCPRCLRPDEFCVCKDLVAVTARTRVVILQHPREARLAICSAWLARISLVNAELHRGVRFGEGAEVRALAARPGAAVLFPGEGSTPAEALAGSPPSILFAVDGTWQQAGKMLSVNPWLGALPRVSIDAGRPSGYAGLRKEPGEIHLSTIEAIALTLGALERDPARFDPMVQAFHRMVALQLACAKGERRSPRHRTYGADRP
ncbi:MAG TPA: tRNA-uridine aminocarboxypropyltransferase [Anaeromyxobacteraceae bacterium]|nr:tRNA-uridine aminocarboxypropyltransferase [Anaeromyxobacteraceae bacterium]